MRQAAEPPQSPGSLLYVLYVLYGIEARYRSLLPGIEAALNPQSPGSLLYVLYVLYGSYTPSRGTSTLPQLLAICTICAILFCTRFKMYYMCYTMHIWYMLEMLCV